MSNRVFGTPWKGFELSVAGRVESHSPVHFQNLTDAQTYMDRNKFTSGDTMRLQSRDGPGSDTTITAA